MKIGIIGAGNVGSALGGGFAKAGHEVVYGLREGSARALPEGARAASVRDAAQGSEVVVLATPWGAVPEALAAAGDLAGRVLVDTTNPIAPGFKLAVGHTNSGGEEVARLAQGARVVKAFNSTGFENMANPRYGERRAAMFLAGDDPGAREVVTRLAADLGFDPVALPTLSRARDLEPLAMLWIRLAIVQKVGRGIAFGIVRRTGAPQPVAIRAARPRVITVAGAGNIGGALARAWLAAGHEVRIAARDPSAADVQALVAAGARAIPVEGAAEGAEVIALAVPAGAAVDVAKRLGDLDGKIVIDTMNALAPGMTLAHGHTTSAAEQLAAALPGARVVKSFNQQGAETLRAPRFDGGVAATNFVAADDEGARQAVIALSEDVGLDAVDAGPLASARFLEPLTTLWITASRPIGTREFGLALLRR